MTKEVCLSSHLFHAGDRNSDFTILVAFYLVWFSEKNWAGSKKFPVIRKADKNAKIATFVQKNLTLDVWFERHFPSVFIVAELDLAMMGMDVLVRNEFIVDTERNF